MLGGAVLLRNQAIQDTQQQQRQRDQYRPERWVLRKVAPIGRFHPSWPDTVECPVQQSAQHREALQVKVRSALKSVRGAVTRHSADRIPEHLGITQLLLG